MHHNETPTILTSREIRQPGRRRALACLLAGAAAAATSRLATAQSPGSVPGPPYNRFYTPTLGPANARVHLVEFLDPACEGCRAFYPAVKQILAENPNRVRVYVRYVALHKGADYAIKAIEAARAQDRLWQAMEVLFAKQSEWTRGHTALPDKVLAVVATVPGIDIERLKKDIEKPEYAKIVEQDMADAKALKLTQTPTFYVNGKPLAEYTFDALRALVKQEIATQYP